MSEADRPIRHAPDFAEVYRAEAPWLVRFFRRQLGSTDDAEDLAQETMLRFIRVVPATEALSPQAYLRRIARNLLHDRFKSAATRFGRMTVPLLAEIDPAGDADQHQELAGRQELQEWERILSKLKPRTLEVFLLSRVDNYSYRDIAAELDMTVSNVKRHMVKAIAHVDRHRRAR